MKKEQSHNSNYLEQVNKNLRYIENNQDALTNAFDELAAYVPSDYFFNCTLFLTLGYDIGIVSEGDALLNIGHSHFSVNLSEMIYYAMHELHHVCYTHYHPIFAFSDLQTNRDLFNVVLYSTQMEGIAVYCTSKRRLSEDGLNDEDYRVLLNPDEYLPKVHEFFEILDDINTDSLRPTEKSDFDILEVMSGRGKRLWYITGAYIAKSIDSCLGRKELVDTIIEGSKSYFDAFKKANSFDDVIISKTRGVS